MRFHILAGFCLAALQLPARADIFNHKIVLVGDKGAALGGAFTGLADDATATFYNPAGLTQIKNIKLNVSAQVIQYQMQKIGIAEGTESGQNARATFFSDPDQSIANPTAVSLAENETFTVNDTPLVLVAKALHPTYEAISFPATSDGKYELTLRIDGLVVSKTLAQIERKTITPAVPVRVTRVPRFDVKPPIDERTVVAVVVDECLLVNPNEVVATSGFIQLKDVAAAAPLPCATELGVQFTDTESLKAPYAYGTLTKIFVSYQSVQFVE